MNRYTTKERKFLKDNIHLKERWDNGLKINTGSEIIKAMAQMQKEYFKIIFSGGCASCLDQMFRNLYNKLNNEKRKRK